MIYSTDYPFASGFLAIPLGTRNNKPLYGARCVGNYDSVLHSGITDATTKIKVEYLANTYDMPITGLASSPRVFDEAQWIQIEQEVMKITAWPEADNQHATVTRAQAGTTAASHGSGSVVCFLFTDGTGSEQPLPIGNPKRMVGCGPKGGTDVGYFTGGCRNSKPLYVLQNCAASQINAQRLLGDGLPTGISVLGAPLAHRAHSTGFVPDITADLTSYPAFAAVSACCSDHGAGSSSPCYRLRGQPMRISATFSDVSGCACLDGLLVFMEGFTDVSGACFYGSILPGGTSDCETLVGCPGSAVAVTIEVSFNRDSTGVCAGNVLLTFHDGADCTGAVVCGFSSVEISQTCDPYSLVIEFSSNNDDCVCSLTGDTFRVTITEEAYP